VLSTSKKCLCGPARAPQPALLLRQTAAIFPPPVASPLALSPGDRIRKKSQSPAASSNIPGSTSTVVGLSRHGHQTARLVNVINHVLLYQFAHYIVGHHSIQVFGMCIDFFNYLFMNCAPSLAITYAASDSLVFRHFSGSSFRLKNVRVVTFQVEILNLFIQDQIG
jgi:hypothetical protein